MVRVIGNERVSYDTGTNNMIEYLQIRKILNVMK